MWSYICPELLQAIESEPESDVAAEMYEALGKVNIKKVKKKKIKMCNVFWFSVHRIVRSRMLVR